MKKIVALALCLALALALCTVAFADVTTTELKVDDGYAVYAIDGGLGTDSATTKFTKTVTGNATAADGTVTYTATQYANDATSTVYWNEVDASCADSKLVNTKTGTVVAYLKYAGTTATKLTATTVVNSYVKVKDAADQTCGDYTVSVYLNDKGAYEAGAGEWAVMNGKFVAIKNTTALNAIGHKFTKANEVNKDGTVANVKCDICKKVFNVTKDVKAMVNGYEALTFAPGYFALIGSTTTTTGVTSAKTFDAGVALYAGMALMSVAGSAVVIGKKKEF